MTLDKIELSAVPETMLQTVYARASETKKGRGFINDLKAVEIVEALNYDFSKAKKDQTMTKGVIARTILLDKLVKEYLDKHENSVVLNLACGLDTRAYRFDKYRTWYNLDLIETMKIRRHFFKETNKIKQISASAMDVNWTNVVEENEEALVIIEGLSMYLNENDIKEIFRIIANKFKKATVFIEVMNPMVVKHVKEKSIGAKFSWGVKNGRELEKLIPNYQAIADYSLCEGMKVFIPIYKLLSKLPFIANISNKIIVLRKEYE